MKYLPTATEKTPKILSAFASWQTSWEGIIISLVIISG